MTNPLSQNPNVFFHVHTEDNGEVSEVSIDFHSIISFCKTKERDGSIELAVKFVNESKAYYSFYEEAPYNRFVEEYNQYVSKRSEIVAIAREMAKDISHEMQAEILKTSEELISEVVKDVRLAVKEEIASFKEEISAQASNIVNTALSHQKEINKENEEYLSNMQKMQTQSKEFVDSIQEFSDRISGIARVVEMVAPTSTSTRMEEEDEKEEIKAEVSSM